jgi:hypothetical protein
VFKRLVQTLKIWRDWFTHDQRPVFRGRLRKLFRRQEAAADKAEQEREEGGGS